MKTAIIIHGMPTREKYLDPTRKSQSNSHWLPWLQQQLITRGIFAQTPEMPEPYDPDYEKWKAVFERFPIDEETLLIGHSCGGGFLVRWLSENKVKVGKVVLVALWMDPRHNRAPKMFDSYSIDENLADKTAELTEFISLDDDKEELDTLEMLKSKLKGLKVKEFADKGHFVFDDMKTDEFPELLNFLIQ